MNNFDIIVIGAGPGGMSAALESSRYSSKVLVLDEQIAPGGQIYKAVGTARPTMLKGLGKSYSKGLQLVNAFKTAGIAYESRANVWHIESDGTVIYSQGGTVHTATGRKVILASGAQERPFPIPGWTLPGVMSAGAAQIALKTTAAAAPGAVFAGYGPLLYLVATQYLRLGVPIRAVIETTPPENWRAALREVGSIPLGWRYLATGIKMIAKLKLARVPLYSGAFDLRAEGNGQLETVSFKHKGNEVRLSGVSNLFLHQGVIPNIALASAAGCQRRWKRKEQYWSVVSDEFGRTSHPSVLMAGDSGGIIGADNAWINGKLVALTAAHELGFVSDADYTNQASEQNALMRRSRKARAFFEALYLPGKNAHIPQDERTVVCRCEDINLAEVRQFVKEGGLNANQFKSEKRCGMGPCQGRMCGLTVNSLLAQELKVDPSMLEPQRARPPAVPVPLRELATIPETGGH